MKVALGIYTTMSVSAPAETFKRAAKLVYGPVLSYLYNNPGVKLSLYQSAAMMKHIDTIGASEYNVLISSLAKRGDLELLTGSYSQTVLSLNPPKDRSSLIEKMTTSIRKKYGVRASSCFLYGQIWAPYYVHALKNSGLSSVVISGYRANLGSLVAELPFTMNELGKRIKVYVMSDAAGQAVSSYAQGKSSLSELEAELCSVISSSKEDLAVFLNIDQLLEGAARSLSGDDVGGCLVRILERFRDSVAPLSQISTNRPGYLDSGWYGRDAWARGLSSFNELFVRNASYRYLLNRYLALSDFAAAYKKDKNLKRYIEGELGRLPMGPLFIFDTQCTPLRNAERRAFWKGIYDSEWKIYEADSTALYQEYDLEELGENNFIARGSFLLAAFSPLGGGVTELSCKPVPFNFFDTRSSFDKDFPQVPVRKSFTDLFRAGGEERDLSASLYSSNLVSKSHGEVQYVRSEPGFLTLSKHYKLQKQTLMMDAQITAERDIEGEYEVTVYLESSSFSLLSQEQRRRIMLDQLDDVRTVRYTEASSGLQLAFSSTVSFSLREEREAQRQDTSLGTESFELYLKLRFIYPVSLRQGQSMSLRLYARVSGLPAEKE